MPLVLVLKIDSADQLDSIKIAKSLKREREKEKEREREKGRGRKKERVHTTA